MLRYLEKGSEKSFNNFCRALKLSNQSHLINEMNDSATKHRQQARCLNEDEPQMSHGLPEECTESSADETRTLSTETTTESRPTQGC